MDAYKSVEKEFDQKMSEIAYMMSYDEFIACVFYSCTFCNNIVGIDKDDNALRIEYWGYCSYETMINIGFVSRYFNDINEKDIQEKYGDDYSLDVYDDIKMRKHYIEFLLNIHIENIPQKLHSLKNRINEALKDLDWQKNMLMDYNSSDVHSFISADAIVNAYYSYLEKDSFGEFYYRYIYFHHETCEVSGLDKFRGCYKEQRIIANVILSISNCGKKCILKLWDLDSGFEELSSRLSGLIENGKVILNLMRYDRLDNTKVIYP